MSNALATMSRPQLLKTVARLKHGTRRVREKAGHVLKTGLVAVETTGTAFLFGVLEAKLTDPKHFELGGVPLPLIAGGALHLAAVLGVGHGMEDHMAALANGALAAHMNGLGRKIGTQWKAKAGTTVKGEFAPGRAGTGPTQADLASLAANG